MVHKHSGRRIRSDQARDPFSDPSLPWIEPGPDNPFGVRFMDLRSIMWDLVSGTADPQVATRFNEMRASDGQFLTEVEIPDSTRVAASLVLPHDGPALEGVVFKSEVMEIKWDIYIYDSTFLFARSWTGDLHYRVPVSESDESLEISEIECYSEEAELAAATVYFLLISHAMGRPFPHQNPRAMQPSDLREIIPWSFSQFGRMGCFPTDEDITNIPLDRVHP